MNPDTDRRLAREAEPYNTLSDLPMPAVVIRESALNHNIAVMAEWTRRHGFEIAPHGKTTMCPQIFRRQLDAGAWGITAATSAQALVCLSAGAKRVLIANQLVVPANIRQLRSALDTFPESEFFCLADSLDGLRILHQFWKGAPKPVHVLLEVGRNGWRTGVRSADTALQLFNEIQELGPDVQFAGLEGFEGSASSAVDAEQFVRSLIAIAHGMPAQESTRIFSVGGSAYLGVLSKTLHELSPAWKPVIRSGCYVTHDHGIYEQRQIESAGLDVPRFQPAIELWAAVQSKPEDGTAILTFGKRNASFDLGLPVPLDLPNCSVTALNDQHAYMSHPPELALRIGDVVRMGISHPCTTFDKWRSIPLVDDHGNIIEVMETYF